jgi:hypothetical protein
MKYKLAIFIVAALWSCNGKGGLQVKNEIAKHIQETCGANPSCIINLNQFLPIKWDRLVVCKATASQKDLDANLGFKYPHFDDVGARTIFIWRDSITHHEDYFPTFEAWYDDDVIFEMDDSISIRTFSNPNFVAKRIQNGEKGYYLLDNIK